jgi:hypothetical protein
MIRALVTLGSTRVRRRPACLLVLRVDRGLEWADLALVWAEGEGDDLRKIEARLRKKFQRTKDKLRRLAEAKGLLDRARPA